MILPTTKGQNNEHQNARGIRHQIPPYRDLRIAQSLYRLGHQASARPTLRGPSRRQIAGGLGQPAKTKEVIINS